MPDQNIADTPAGQDETADPDPRSPRPANPALPTTTPTTPARNLAFPPGPFGGLETPPPAPRPSIGNLLFLSAFFFFMSGNNNVPQQIIVVGPDGQLQPRFTELDRARQMVGEYAGFLNGTGNWTEPTTPSLLSSPLIPHKYQHHDGQFWTNITGFYRQANVHLVDLLESSSIRNTTTFFNGVHLPDLNNTDWNNTLSEELRGSFDWASMTKWSMNLKERIPEGNHTDLKHCSWVRGSATLEAKDEKIDYAFYGLHHIPNGTYNLFGKPDGTFLDIRNIPLLYPHHQNISRSIILAEMEKELKTQEESFMLTDVKQDDPVTTSCPLLIHFALPPLPHGADLSQVELWESEMLNPSGIRSSLRRPPNYWDGVGLGGVVVADQCGFAFGLEGGKGMQIDEFWNKGVNYAVFASITQLIILVSLVRQMESTRTPSTLAKVSLWTIVLMGIADSWIFSAHVVFGIMSDNQSSLPLLVPGFLCLCTALVFGPRYAVLLYRIQAPERPTRRPITTAPAAAGSATGAPPAPVEDDRTWMERIEEVFSAYPAARFLFPLSIVFGLYVLTQFGLSASIILFALYSFWIPQIWRSARRGTSSGLSWSFIIGTSLGRLALPLYAFGCPENIFFTEVQSSVWILVIWQWAQITMLFSQDRFGPAFFLPKRYQPAESYNYHPILPQPDPQAPKSESSDLETTCSICMEPVDIHHLSAVSSAGEAILGLGNRKGYALAPCHHLFHTKCLAQWLAIKTICPLCKRSLPPL